MKYITYVNMMNRHAVEGEYFHVILLTDDSTVRSLDRSRSFDNTSRFNYSCGSIISANACPSEAAAVQIVEEVHHHINCSPWIESPIINSNCIMGLRPDIRNVEILSLYLLLYTYINI
jgi:hypothetical protein